MTTQHTDSVEATIEEFYKRFTVPNDSSYMSCPRILNELITPSSVEEWLRTTLHHQLQKARTEGYEQGLRDAERTWTNRYQAELDQPTEDKKYCNGEPCICGETNTNQLKV